ncbi:MAG: hypothetical protein IT435_12955 [Phycisphaerales bacterium]|nr:hypothetical protein [Phycisphaerales bacterium]
MSGANPAQPPLEYLLVEHRSIIEAIVRRDAGVVLMRFESSEDLSQGIAQEAIRSAAQFRWEGPEAFAGWLAVIARRYLSGRRDYWLAHKRNPGVILRLTFTSAGGQRIEHRELADTAAGPATFAFRKEQLVMATRALAMLLPRDRDIVTWLSEGLGIDEISARLGIARDAAEKARTRALDRLRKTFAILARQEQPPHPGSPENTRPTA